ncbi:hypothetical protein [Peribacillus butanolivorans]|uniref:hypothetical protein n=1 Tax=Peribacillus butanolivorans TaxID=421767 RepID=UPI00167F652E|nr:hypothetical protein [Peribacillus butanolivorans]QNU04806.1 hypothetical protein GM240_13240 [Peribacillus butanolivorans]
MILNETCELDTNKKVIHSFQRSIEITSAILLLTGQITIIGIFVRPGRFSLSLGGPLFGGHRLEGKDHSQEGNLFIDILDIIIAILLINDVIHVTGLFVSSGEFTINVSGPIFGYPEVTPALPIEDYNLFNTIITKHYIVPPELLTNIRGNE